MKNKIISILCAMAISLTAFAQTNVKGVVTDKNGEAVTGASESHPAVPAVPSASHRLLYQTDRSRQMPPLL